MEAISVRMSDAIYASAAAENVKGTRVQETADQVPNPSQRPVTDTYAPQEKREPAGRYWLGQDEDGKPKIYFDDPERAAAPETGQKAAVPEKRPAADQEESCTGSTDGVDREMEKLKKKREELERQIRFATDDTKIAELERKLAQVENELRQKDNDTYRRQHTVFS